MLHLLLKGIRMQKIRYGLARKAKLIIVLFACTGWGAHALESSSNKLDAEQLSALVDQQFVPITIGKSPGFGVVIIHNGATLVRRSYGFSDLENEHLIKSSSRFYIASMSKQFTAAMIAKLVVDQRLTLNDEVREYLPDLPPAYDTVTIGNLLFHTGGVREYTSLMLIRGDDADLEGHMNTTSAYELLKSQQALDFEPGTEYRYSSSGYVLLAKIIERLERKAFSVVAKDTIFEPLGMQETLFDNNHAAVVPARVKSYKPGPEGQWLRWLKHFDVVGDGGVLTTTNDIARWDAELSTGDYFGPQWQNLMHSSGTLSDGRNIPYGFGLWQTKLGGHKVYAHGGGMGGFISDQIRFPSLGLSLYVFSNRNDDHAFQAWDLARTILDTLGLKVDDMRHDDLGAMRPLAHDHIDWLGAYFSDALNNRFFLRENTEGFLVLHDGGDAWMTDLYYSDGGKGFKTTNGDNIELVADGESQKIFIKRTGRNILATRYDATPPENISQLSKLAAAFWSPELESLVCFSIENNAFTMRYAKGLSEQLFPVPVGSSVTWNALDKIWTGRSMAKFRYGPSGKVSDVTIGDGRVTGVNFHRINGLISCS